MFFDADIKKIATPSEIHWSDALQTVVCNRLLKPQDYTGNISLIKTEAPKIPDGEIYHYRRYLINRGYSVEREARYIAPISILNAETQSNEELIFIANFDSPYRDQIARAVCLSLGLPMEFSNLFSSVRLKKTTCIGQDKESVSTTLLSIKGGRWSELYKGNPRNSRLEMEFEIDSEDFDRLVPFAVFNGEMKIRYNLAKNVFDKHDNERPILASIDFLYCIFEEGQAYMVDFEKTQLATVELEVQTKEELRLLHAGRHDFTALLNPREVRSDENQDEFKFWSRSHDLSVESRLSTLYQTLPDDRPILLSRY